jgi:hypothetical protein
MRGGIGVDSIVFAEGVKSCAGGVETHGVGTEMAPLVVAFWGFGTG